jgi:hypothetical protein
MDGKVKEHEVMFIAANTNCPDLSALLEIVEEYYYGANGRAYSTANHPLEDVKALAQRLYDGGKLHQPRLVMSGWGNSHHLKDTWYDIVPTPSTHNESVVDAYEKYRMLATLAE